MDLNTVKFSEQSKQAALKLRLKVELHLGKNIKKVDTIESLLTLLKYSKKSVSVEIKTAYAQFTQSLTSDQVSFFNTLGLDLDAVEGASKKSNGADTKSSESIYRGAHLFNKASNKKLPNSADASAIKASAADAQRKKKMYRGTEVL